MTIEKIDMAQFIQALTDSLLPVLKAFQQLSRNLSELYQVDPEFRKAVRWRGYIRLVISLRSPHRAYRMTAIKPQRKQFGVRSCRKPM